jgi:hypothetical protein
MSMMMMTITAPQPMPQPISHFFVVLPDCCGVTAKANLRYSKATTLTIPMVAPLSSVVQESLTEITFDTAFSAMKALTMLSRLLNSSLAWNILRGDVKVLTFAIRLSPFN